MEFTWVLGQSTKENQNTYNSKYCLTGIVKDKSFYQAHN